MKMAYLYPYPGNGGWSEAVLLGMPLLLLPLTVAPPLAYPKAWIGAWEGPAKRVDGGADRLRIEFTPGGRIILTQTQKTPNGRTIRDVCSGVVWRDRSGFTFNYTGIRRYGPTSAQDGYIGEDGRWFLQRLKLAAGRLTGTLRIDPTDKDLYRFELRRVR